MEILNRLVSTGKKQLANTVARTARDFTGLTWNIEVVMKKKLAFVLGGGGSRGALQVGALRALIEAGYLPNLVTGTSIGAANAALLGIHGYSQEGVEKLANAWKTTIDKDLLPTNLWRQTMQAFFRRNHGKGFSQDRIREFAISNGLTPDLRYKDLSVPVYPVAADLNSGQPVIFGQDPEELVLGGVLASMALPPWVAPLESKGRVLIDGGAVSSLPIEAALQQGATEIIALDLSNPNEINHESNGFGDFFVKLDKTVESRHARLEMELAEARGVPVRRISLVSDPPVPLWDFRHSVELMEIGYQLAVDTIATWPPEAQPSWWQRLGIQSMIEDLIEVM